MCLHGFPWLLFDCVSMLQVEPVQRVGNALCADCLLFLGKLEAPLIT